MNGPLLLKCSALKKFKSVKTYSKLFLFHIRLCNDLGCQSWAVITSFLHLQLMNNLIITVFQGVQLDWPYLPLPLVNLVSVYSDCALQTSRGLDQLSSLSSRWFDYHVKVFWSLGCTEKPLLLRSLFLRSLSVLQIIPAIVAARLKGVSVHAADFCLIPVLWNFMSGLTECSPRGNRTT